MRIPGRLKTASYEEMASLDLITTNAIYYTEATALAKINNSTLQTTAATQNTAHNISNNNGYQQTA